MKIVFDKNDYKTYKQMYEDLAIKLGTSLGPKDYYDISTFDYDPNCLYEELCYGKINKSSNHYVFKNFDLEKIKTEKSYDNYKYNLIIEVFQDFVKGYPNNTLEFIND